jgi:hypothetical protein
MIAGYPAVTSRWRGVALEHYGVFGVVPGKVERSGVLHHKKWYGDED